ncbi:MAG: tetratricopeptide repeat protein [Ruminiclostridium sp.]
MAYCYGQLGDGAKSKELYQKVIEQFPGSKVAESAMKMYDAAKNI